MIKIEKIERVDENVWFVEATDKAMVYYDTSENELVVILSCLDKDFKQSGFPALKGNYDKEPS
jgi:hypothetical protein